MFWARSAIQGYEYLVIDDCWASDRGEDGVLIPDPAAFPDGMKAVADYVHSKDRTMGSPMGFVPKKWHLTSYGWSFYPVKIQFYQFVNI